MITGCRATLIACSLAPAALPVSSASLCQPSEQTVFSCPTDHGRQIALCLGPQVLTYRYGTPTKPELERTDPGADQPGAFRYFHYFRAGVDRTSVAFETAEARYEVYAETEAPQPTESGVRVTLQAGGREVTIPCARPPRAQWHLIEGRLACADEALNSCTAPARR